MKGSIILLADLMNKASFWDSVFIMSVSIAFAILMFIVMSRDKE